MGRNNENGKKRGRPVGKNGGRYNLVNCLLTDEERDMLREASILHGKSQSEIIRAGIKSQINLMKYR